VPTTTLTPSAIGTDNGGVLAAGADKVSAVDPPDDDGTSNIYCLGAGTRQSYAMDDLPSEAVSIVSHTLRARSGSGSPGTATGRGYLRLSGSITAGATRSGGIYQTFTDPDLAQPGGGAWTPSNVNSSEAGVECVNDPDSAAWYTTTLSWDVTWSGAAGSYAFLIWEWLGLVPAAIGFGDLARLIRGYNAWQRRARRSPTLIRGREALELYRDLREAPWPRVFDLAPARAEVIAIWPVASNG
jgi:hypothetical protein